MTAWGMVAVCSVGGGVVGPLLDGVARRAAGRAASGAVPSTEPALVPSPAQFPTAAPPAAGAGAAPSGRGEIPAVSAVTALLWGLAAARIGTAPQLVAYCLLFGSLVAVSVTDLHTGLVPRSVLYPALGLTAVALLGASAAQQHWRPMVDAVAGGAAGFVVFAAIWWVYPRGMGFGDVRLAGLCGAGLGWLGWREVYLGFLAAFVAGAVMGLAVLAVRRTRRFPFAPAMAAGTVLGVLWGGWLGNQWLHPG